MSFAKVMVRGFVAGCLFTFLSISPVSAATAGVVTGDNVNIREQASTDSGIITKVNSGQTLNIIGKEGSFFKIRHEGQDCYITSEWVDITTPEGEILANNVNVRVYPSTDADVVTKISNDVVNVLGRAGDWYKIEYNGKEGYIREDYISGWPLAYAKAIDAPKMPVAEEKTNAANKLDTSSSKKTAPAVNVPASGSTDTYAVINATGLRLREEPSLDADVLEKVRSGAILDVIDYDNDWVNVVYNGKPGYVSAEFVSLGFGDRPVRDNPKAQEIIDYGKQFLGTPYQFAGNDLSSGVDCSGFVYNVFKHFDIDLYRSSRDMVNDGYAVGKEELIPGDLVFFDTNGGDNQGNISHVGIYMGGGQFIHSSSSTRTWGVVISSLNDEYYIRTYVSACRVLA